MHSRLHSCILATACLLAGSAWAQTAPAARPIKPLSTATAQEAFSRPLGAATRPPQFTSSINLKGKRSYIAEYLLLIEVGGERPVKPDAGLLLGQSVSTELATLAFRAEPDIAALQALTDRAWLDLQTRLAARGVVVADAAETISRYGAVYEATEPGSVEGAPVYIEAKVGDVTRRYLVMTPTGMKMVKRTVAGIGLGNVAARLAFPAQGVEGLSLAMAINVSALDDTGQRQSSLLQADGSGGPALSPLLELAPAPGAALVHAHAQLELANLNEALMLATEFGRLRPLLSGKPRRPPSDPIGALLGLGKRLLAPDNNTRVESQLELDGPSTARLIVFATAAGNQAMAEALKAAQ